MRALALLLVVAAFGCSDNPSAPIRYGAEVPLTVIPNESPTSDAQSVNGASFAKNLLTVYGRIVTPDPCFNLSAYRQVQGRDVRVTIVAKRYARSCPSSVDHFEYNLLSDYPPCPHLSVAYHFEGADTPDLAIYDNDTGPCITATARQRQARRSSDSSVTQAAGRLM